MTSQFQLSAMQYAILWFGTGIAMLVHSIGFFAGWWSTNHITWWIALTLMLCSSVATTIESFTSERGNQ